ncbi:MAG: arsenite methyltransferase [Candidatus Dormibacter sp.]
MPEQLPAEGPAAVREGVRSKYASLALNVLAGPQSGAAACCDSDCGCGEQSGEASFGAHLYDDAERSALPGAAVQASLGCGNPLAVAELREGEVVLDLGSGGGIDVLLSAGRVGPSGTVYGLDMTDEMLELARRNTAEAGATNVEFIKGTIEAIPLPADSVDVVISNCVINLSPDKSAVISEMFRVLRPGGRLGISDVVAEDRLTQADRMQRGSHAGCIAGALSLSEYRQGLLDAGFGEVDITFTHEVADGMHGAIVRGVKSAAP